MTQPQFYVESVFETSTANFKRFNDLMTSAKQLETICLDGEALMQGFVQVIGDVWYAFYAMYPKFTLAIPLHLEAHSDFIHHLVQLEEYQNWHPFTQTDDLLSTLTTITIGEQLISHLKRDQQIKKAAFRRNLAEQKKQYAQNQLEQLQAVRSRTKLEQNQIKIRLQMAQNSLKLSEQQIIQENEPAKRGLHAFKHQLVSTLMQSKEQVVEKKNAVVALATMDGKKLHQIPMKEQFLLAEQLTSHPSVLQVAEMAGRFKKIAKKKMKTTAQFTIEQKNISIGNEISRLIPLELANYVLPTSRQDFLRRYAEAQTFVFNTKGKEMRGKGPIIICMDESSSMHPIKAESKAFCLALLMIAKKQKRDFAIIPFASEIGPVQFFLKGNATSKEVLQFSQQFLGGGTDYEKPLRKSLEILLKSEFNEADILFVTDGSSFLPISFIDEFNAIKMKRKFECTSIVITNLMNRIDLSLVNRFSDKVLEVKNLFEAEEIFALS